MMSAVLAELSGLDQNLQPVAGSMRDAMIALEEVAFDLSRYLDKLDLDPGELAEVSDRLNTVNRILNKYGDPLDATLAYRAEIGAKVAELERATDDLSTIEKEIAPLLKDAEKLGKELSAKRQAVGKKLGPQIERALAELGMEKAKFSVQLTSAAGTIPGEPSLPATPSGFDAVEFVAQTNPGQLAQPLRKIASGGELSRIMLALKGILAQSDRISVLVFDEIDANVGGRLGSIIGNKLRGPGEPPPGAVHHAPAADRRATPTATSPSARRSPATAPRRRSARWKARTPPGARRDDRRPAHHRHHAAPGSGAARRRPGRVRRRRRGARAAGKAESKTSPEAPPSRPGKNGRKVRA
jgi:hypothetical protein